VQNITIDCQGHTISGYTNINYFTPPAVPQGGATTIIKNGHFTGPLTTGNDGGFTAQGVTSLQINGDHNTTQNATPAIQLINCTVAPSAFTASIEGSCLIARGNNILIDTVTVTGDPSNASGSTDDDLVLSSYLAYPTGGGQGTVEDVYYVTVQNSSFSNAFDCNIELVGSHMNHCTFTNNQCAGQGPSSGSTFNSTFSSYPVGSAAAGQPPINSAWANNTAAASNINNMWRFAGVGAGVADTDAAATTNWGASGNTFSGDTHI